MKRNKKLAHGPSVQYYQHSSGVVNKRKPAVIRIFLPMVVSMCIIAGGGYVGFQQYEKQAAKPVQLSNASQFESVPVSQTESTDIDLKSFQAKEDEGLAREIQKTVDEMPSDTQWAISVRDLNSGRMANINSDKKMQAASLYKMFLLAPLEKKLSANYWKSYVGKQSIENCVTGMISVSDNDCGQAIGYYVGWNSIDLSNHELGFNDTNIANANGDTFTTSKDVSELMYRLQNSMMLSDKARRIVFDALYDQQFRQGIPTGCGSECVVGNKTGDLDGVKNDAAVVQHGDARYVVVIMSSGNSNWKQVGDLAKSIDIAMRP